MNNDQIRSAIAVAREAEPNPEPPAVYAIGSDLWPGLSKLAEECGEIIQIIGKLMATGGRREHWSGLDLWQALEEEMGDLRAAISYVTARNGLDVVGIAQRKDLKIELFDLWHDKGL